MPIFDYKCLKCNTIERDVLVSINKVNESRYCKKCNNKMVKLPSAAKAKFKGSGFYQTDYKEKQ